MKPNPSYTNPLKRAKKNLQSLKISSTKRSNMERVNVKCLFMVLAIAVTALFLHSHQAVAAELSVNEEPQARKPRLCHGDLKKLMRCCRPWIKKEGKPTQPPDSCCIPLLLLDVPCICRKISPYYLRMISMKKFVWAVRTCGRPILKGTNCGGYIVPSS